MAKEVFSTKWFSIDEVLAPPEWNMGSEPFYRFNAPDNAIVIPLTPDRQFIMVRQFRPAREIVTLEFPAGLVEPGETPEQAAIREFHEETGCNAENLEALGKSGLGNNREASTYYLFVAFDVDYNKVDSEEGIEVVTVDPGDIADLIRRDEMDLLATAGILFMAKAKLGNRMPDIL